MAPLANLVELFVFNNFQMGVVKEQQQIWTKNAQKFIHKLNQQETEWWNHLANLTKLMLAKDF